MFFTPIIIAILLVPVAHRCSERGLTRESMLLYFYAVVLVVFSVVVWYFR